MTVAEAMTRQESIDKIADLVHEIRTAMLVTLDEHGRPRSRPMGTMESRFDGTIWFFTSMDSTKVTEIEQNAKVNVAYAKSSSEAYLSLTGTAAVLNDRERMRELWTPILRVWFESVEDPALRLIRIDVDEAEYWDTPGGKVGALFRLVKGMVTGGGEDLKSDNGYIIL